MIQKLINLEPFIPNDSVEYDSYGLELEDRKEKVIVLNFQIEKDNIQFTGSDLYDYKKEDNQTKWFFKRSQANSVSDFPTIFVSDRDFLLDDSDDQLITTKAIGKWFRIWKNCLSIDPILEPISTISRVILAL